MDVFTANLCAAIFFVSTYIACFMGMKFRDSATTTEKALSAVMGMIGPLIIASLVVMIPVLVLALIRAAWLGAL